MAINLDLQEKFYIKKTDNLGTTCSLVKLTIYIFTHTPMAMLLKAL